MKATLLVNTCDAYHDVLDLFFSALNENWKLFNYEIIVNSEFIPYKNKKYNITNSIYKADENISGWGARVKKALLMTDSDYVIFMLDDYIIESSVDQERIDEIIVFMSKNVEFSGHYLTLHPLNSNKKQIFKSSFKIDDCVAYKVNTGPAIWRRSILIDLLDDMDDPWSWEFFAQYKDNASRLKLLTVGSKDSNIINYRSDLGGAIYRGKWVKEVVLDKVLEYNLSLNLADRGFADFVKPEKRTFAWKLGFLQSGYRMIGIKSFLHFATHYFGSKILKLKDKLFLI